VGIPQPVAGKADIPLAGADALPASIHPPPAPPQGIPYFQPEMSFFHRSKPLFHLPKPF